MAANTRCQLICSFPALGRCYYRCLYTAAYGTLSYFKGISKLFMSTDVYEVLREGVKDNGGQRLRSQSRKSPARARSGIACACEDPARFWIVDRVRRGLLASSCALTNSSAIIALVRPPAECSGSRLPPVVTTKSSPERSGNGSAICPVNVERPYRRPAP